MKYEVGMIIKYERSGGGKFRYCRITEISEMLNYSELRGYWVDNLKDIDRVSEVFSGYLRSNRIGITIIGNNPNSNIIINVEIK